MKILIIEDDPNKADKLLDFLKENYSSSQVSLRKSYQSGIKEIFESESEFDLILLDMSIPTYDQDQGNFSGKPRNFGGRDILKEMKRYNLFSKVIVVTQYNEFDGGSLSIKNLDNELSIKYSNLYQGYIYYKSGQSNWEKELLKFIDSMQ